MKINYKSDLHLEFSNYSPSIEIDQFEVLIIAGDLCESNNIKDYHLFLDNISKQYKKVFVVLGNHEFYTSSFSLTKTLFLSSIEKYDNIHLLDNDFYIYKDIVFIGSTLWSDFNNKDPICIFNSKRYMNDFRLIFNNYGTKFLPEDAIVKFNENVSFIKNICELYKNKKKIVITHHTPSWQSVNKKYKDDSLNGAYCSNLEEFILNSNIDYWIHGHVHSSFNYMIGNTHICCNPKGYRNENLEYDSYKYFEI